MLLCCVASGTACMAVIVFDYFQRPEPWLPHLIVGLGHLTVCLTFLCLRWSATMAVPATAIMVVTCCQLLSATWWSGGPHSSVFVAYPIATVFVGFLGGRKLSLIAAAILSLGAILIYQLADNGFTFGSGPATDEVMLGSLVWAILTGSGIAVYTQLQTDGLLLKAQEEVRRRRDAQEVAERANDAKNMFMAYLSHEIRNPLAVIMGSADLIGLPGKEDQYQRHMNAMRVASNGLSSLLDDVMDFALLERDQIVVRNESVDLNTLLCEITDLYSVEAEKKGLEISFQGSTETQVLGDTGRLRQVMSNLVGNAVKFTKTGSVRVQMSRDRDRVQVYVIDSGPGIKPERRARIFQPFVRGQTDKIPGSGLGLAVSRALLVRMKTDLCLETSDSGGCSFHFSLPIVDESIQPPAVVSKAPESILIVDDNVAAATLLQEMVHDLGCKAEVISSSLAALKRLETYRPDVVLLDVNMPELSGKELARKVLEIWGLEPPRIWFITGNPMVSPEGLSEGVLLKPVTSAQLKKSLRIP